MQYNLLQLGSRSNGPSRATTPQRVMEMVSRWEDAEVIETRYQTAQGPCYALRLAKTGFRFRLSGQRSSHQYTTVQLRSRSMPGAREPNLNWRALALVSVATCTLTAASLLLLLDRRHLRSSRRRRSHRRRHSSSSSSQSEAQALDNNKEMPGEGERRPELSTYTEGGSGGCV